MSPKDYIVKNISSSIGVPDTKADSFTLKAPSPVSRIIIEMGIRDYSLSEISRILEGNNAHLMSLDTTFTEAERLRLELRIDLEDVSPVVRSFERFDYNVVYYESAIGAVSESDEIFRERLAGVARILEL
jgi:hypothetical protein